MTREEQARAHFQAACNAMSERPGDEWAVMAQRVDTLRHHCPVVDGREG